MPRYIDADEFVKRVIQYPRQSTKTIGLALADTPTADVVEREHGAWFCGSDIYGNKFMNCSQCHTDTDIPEMYDWEDARAMYHFCPFCGADMRKEADNAQLD